LDTVVLAVFAGDLTGGQVTTHDIGERRGETLNA